MARGNVRRYGTARRIDGGIEARTKRGSIGRSWWSKELISAMEEVAEKGRLTRGRAYARAGQVISMRLEPGAAVGDVQGSQLTPFTSAVRVRTLDEEAVGELVSLVRSSPGMLARLAAGILPEELGSALLPRRAGELDFDCTCPDDGWPCKHAAAVAYLLAEHVDDQPFAVLTLRGVDLATLIGGVDDAGADEEVSAARDFYGDDTELSELPTERFRPALEDLDPMLLRRALRAGGTDEAVVIRGIIDLEDLYRRMR
ncbi:SWIM zinc finger family protein [Rhodococcus pyridinivorans]|uniref:SWIM zinc finger family protein n=1 Tax=Rhodococcus pyridinivorans TaxID=103816 RepID=UPI0020C73C11|nr:SWIM zinc finger family protein [Rhodococcus pyridinivorans]UTM38673.1 SWIM zinc finger family protein [Rhodococcus pyridinivorans]